MFLKKISFQVFVFLIIIFLYFDISASKCEDDCDWPWPSECAVYCATQRMALTKRSFHNAPVYIAWRKGFFRGYGLDTAVAYYGRSPEVIHKIVSPVNGKPMFGLVNASIAFRSIEGGAPLKTIMSIEEKLPYVLMGAKGISVKELKGKVVAMPSFWTEKSAIYEALSRGGMKIHFQEGFQGASQALWNKSVDLAVLPITKWSIAEKYGFMPVAPISEFVPYFLASTIVINEKYRDKNRQEFIKFSAAMLKALEFFYKNKDETIEIVEKELAPLGLGRKDLEIIYDFYKNNNIFKRDGIVTPEAFKYLQMGLKFENTIDLSYINEAKARQKD